MSRRDAHHLLSTWHFWMTLFGFALIGVIVALWVNYGRVSTDQARTSRIVAARHADIVANADAQYIQCVKSIPTLARINKFIRGVQDEHAAILTNSLASHAATPKGSDLWDAQVKNIARLRKADNEVKHVHFPVPTKQACRDLRKALTIRD